MKASRGYVYIITGEQKATKYWKHNKVLGTYKSYPGAVYAIGKMSKKLVRNAEIVKIPIGNYVDGTHISKKK